MSKLFDDYLFHASGLGNIMPGIPKALTERQVVLFDKLHDIRRGLGERMTPKQKDLLENYGLRFAGAEGTRPLNDNQILTYEDLLLKSQTPVSLSDSQIVSYGELLARKNAKCELTPGVKNYLTKKVWEFISGRSTQLQNKFFDKGNAVEEKSLTIYSNQKDTLVLKNQETKKNKYVIGTADIARYKIRDIKSSWTWHTFPLTKDSIPSKGYEWQLDAYMYLWGLQRAELIYCLIDTPFKLIDDELRRLDWKYNIMDQDGDIRDDQEIIDLVVEVIMGHIYTFKGLEKYVGESPILNLDWFIGKFKEVPEEVRIKIFKHNRSEQRIKYIEEMVILSREYMNSVIDEIGENAFILHEQALV